MSLALVSPLLVAAVMGCGGASGDLVVVSGKPFSQEGLNGEGNAKGQQKVLERLAKQPPAMNPDVAVAMTGTAEITGLDLASGKTWKYGHPLDHRPRLAGPLVVASGGGEVFALDARSGAEKWKSQKLKGKLIGAGSDGTSTALTFTVDEGSRFVVLGPDGSIKVDKTTDMPLAAPGVASGVALVPWKALYVTAFDANSGDQLATFVTDTETTHVLPIGGAMFAGQGRLVRFDANLPNASKGGSSLAVPPESLPNVSRRDIYVPPEHDQKLTADAIDQTVLAGKPTKDGPAGFVADRIYGGYYKLIMAWTAKEAKLAWVYTGKADVLAATATNDGVVIVDESGEVKLLAAANGAVTKTFSFGKPVLNADVSADSVTVGAGTSPGDLTDQIKQAVTLNSNDLATAQLYLVQQLATNPDEDATRVLLEVADAERTSTAMKDEARKAISIRTNGAATMLEMLARHANFLTDARTPPVGPMATALAAMKEKKAAGPLLDQLLDPALPQKDLLDTANGVGALASAEQVPQLEKFINLYRGSATGNLALTDAIGSIAHAIIRLGGAKGKEFVVATSKDALTDTDVKGVLDKAIAASEPKKPEKKDDEGKDEGKDKDKKPKIKDDGPVPGGLKGKDKDKAKSKDKSEKSEKSEKTDKTDKKPEAKDETSDKGSAKEVVDKKDETTEKKPEKKDEKTPEKKPEDKKTK
jgi:outer membrane protein assembly factor BamB